MGRRGSGPPEGLTTILTLTPKGFASRVDTKAALIIARMARRISAADFECVKADESLERRSGSALTIQHFNQSRERSSVT